MSERHETHVCRDCGAEITMPYARPSDDLTGLDVERLGDAIDLHTTEWEHCGSACAEAIAEVYAVAALAAEGSGE